MTCKKCGSNMLISDAGWRTSGDDILLISIEKCHRCGHRWETDLVTPQPIRNHTVLALMSQYLNRKL